MAKLPLPNGLPTDDEDLPFVDARALGAFDSRTATGPPQYRGASR